MSELEQLARAGAARWVLNAVTRYLRASASTNGGRPTYGPEVTRFLEILVAIESDTDVSARGHPSDRLNGTRGMVPLVEAAAELNCGERRARRAVKRGRVLGRQVAHRWFVDVDGLRNYLADADRRPQ